MLSDEFLGFGQHADPMLHIYGHTGDMPKNMDDLDAGSILDM